MTYKVFKVYVSHITITYWTTIRKIACHIIELNIEAP